MTPATPFSFFDFCVLVLSAVWLGVSIGVWITNKSSQILGMRKLQEVMIRNQIEGKIQTIINWNLERIASQSLEELKKKTLDSARRLED